MMAKTTSLIHHPHHPNPFYAALVTVLRYMSLALIFMPMIMMGVYWIYVLLNGPLVEDETALRGGMETLVVMTAFSMVCVALEFMVVLPVITSDKAREVHGADD